MYNLNLFDERRAPLSDYMPFARLTAIRVAGNRCAICLNKDGSIMATFRYRGPDLASSVDEELAVLTNRLQAEIGLLKTNNVLYFEAQRVPTTAYETTNNFCDDVTRGIDALGEVTVRIQAEDGRVFTGRGSDNDIVVSSAKAYVNAINRMIQTQRSNEGK